MLILRFSNLISLYKNQRKVSLKLEKSMILTGPILRYLFKSGLILVILVLSPEFGPDTPTPHQDSTQSK